MTDQNRRFRRALRQWLRDHTIAIAVWNVIMYLALIPATLFLFPNTNLVTAVLVLLTGVTSSISSLGSLLTDIE